MTHSVAGHLGYSDNPWFPIHSQKLPLVAHTRSPYKSFTDESPKAFQVCTRRFLCVTATQAPVRRPKQPPTEAPGC